MRQTKNAKFMPEIRHCQACKTEYTARTSASRFCSSKCRSSHHNAKRRTLTCADDLLIPAHSGSANEGVHPVDATVFMRFQIPGVTRIGECTGDRIDLFWRNDIIEWTLYEHECMRHDDVRYFELVSTFNDLEKTNYRLMNVSGKWHKDSEYATLEIMHPATCALIQPVGQLNNGF